MKNYIQKGDVLEYTVPAEGTVTAGTPVVIGSMLAIPAVSGVAADVVACKLTGVYELPKVAGEIVQGTKVYWNHTLGKITTTPTGFTFAGFVWATAANADTTILVKLSPGANIAATVAAIGEVANLTAVPAEFADLAAARVAVNTLATETEARLDAIEAKIDALITSLKNASIVA